MAPSPSLQEDDYFKSVFKSRAPALDSDKDSEVFLVTKATKDIVVCFFIFELHNEWICEYSRGVTAAAATTATPTSERDQISKNNELILLQALKFKCWEDLFEMNEIQWTILTDADVDESNSEDKIHKALSEIRSFRQNLSNDDGVDADATSTNAIGFVECKLRRAAQLLIENDIQGFMKALSLKMASMVNLQSN